MPSAVIDAASQEINRVLTPGGSCEIVDEGWFLYTHLPRATDSFEQMSCSLSFLDGSHKR